MCDWLFALYFMGKRAAIVMVIIAHATTRLCHVWGTLLTACRFLAVIQLGEANAQK
jgi:hypothetical protein